MDERGDPVGDFAGVFVFPEPDRGPAKCVQSPVRVGVPRTIGLDLLAPEICIALRPGAVLRATVPETAIDEDGYPCTGENDVGGAPQPGQNWHLETITEALGVQGLTEADLRSRAFLPHAGYPAAGVLR